jgi:hypothetical protein
MFLSFKKAHGSDLLVRTLYFPMYSRGAFKIKLVGVKSLSQTQEGPFAQGPVLFIHGISSGMLKVRCIPGNGPLFE